MPGVVLKLIALALLAGYLALKQRQREMQRSETAQRDWNGAAFDCDAIAPRIREVRRDYLATLHARPFQTGSRRARLSAARQLLQSCRFFCGRTITVDESNVK